MSALTTSPPPQNVMDDMDDQQELGRLRERAQAGARHLGTLIEALEILNKTILGAYRDADRKAIRNQKRYRSLAFWSTITGALAVLLALLPVSDSTLKNIATALEATCAAVSMGIVIYALIRETRESWLLERYRAERMRLEKFAALLDPHCWDGPSRDHWKSKLEGRISDLLMEVETALDAWTAHGTAPSVREAPRSISQTLAEEIRSYYLDKRLAVQLQYLRTKFPQERHREKSTKYAGPILFYASVAVIFTHTILDFGANSAKESWLESIVFLAASLPAFAAAVRTHRAASEYGRNALRHEATYHTLRELEGRLAGETAPAGIFRIIGFSEQVLEADTREWMRLMKEAEWFG
jgi:hypothetical protein